MTSYLLAFHSALPLLHFASASKVAYVIRPLKLDMDPSALKDYRPISSLCYVSKLLNTIVSTCLMFHLEDSGLLSQVQHGFCRRHSIEQAIWISYFLGLQFSKLEREPPFFSDILRAHLTALAFCAFAGSERD